MKYNREIICFIQDESTVLVHSIDPTMDINIISIALVEVGNAMKIECM